VTLTRVQFSDRPVMLAVCRDLTERRRAEAALRESEERFKAFMDNSPAIAFIKDDHGTLSLREPSVRGVVRR
jgi:PAS domain-containing protein